ncbi:MAG: hypothetical protein IPF81_14790 [Bacteroidetes bacterium]|nr:hypothetical protein [Bacteroidota bacterium]
MSTFQNSDLSILLRLFSGEGKKVFVFAEDQGIDKRGSFPIQIFHHEESIVESEQVILLISDPDYLSEIKDLEKFSQIILLSGSRHTLPGFHSKSFHGISNPDKTLRWIYPVELTKPTFLNLYNASTWKGRLFQGLIKIAFHLGLRSSAASLSFTLYSRQPSRLDNLLQQIDHHQYSIFTGTVGVNRKCIVEVNSKGKTTHFIKIPLNTHSGFLIRNEKQMLEAMKNSGFKSMTTPRVIHVEEMDAEVVDNIKPEKVIHSTEFTALHAGALVELYMKNLTAEKIRSSEFAERVIQNIYLVKKNVMKKSLPVAEQLLEKLQVLQKNIDLSSTVHFGISHGDFTPWNMYSSENKLHVYDWELARRDAPVLFDLFHFIFQKEVMIRKSSLEKIEAEIRKALDLPAIKEFIKVFKIDAELHYKLYLLSTISYYLNVYLLQEKLHPQAYWLMDTWDEALSRTLPAAEGISQRKLFIRNYFKQIRFKKYAMLKFIHASIEDIPEYSDLDMLVSKEDLPDYLKLLKRQSGVVKTKVYRKSFMTTVELYFEDQSFVSLDLIHKFQRKGLEYLDAKKVLRSAISNVEGIRVPDKRFCFEYTWLFYTLNGASLPERYVNYYNSLDYVQRGQILNHLHSSFKFRSDDLQDFVKYQPKQHKNIIHAISKYPSNTPINNLKSKINYLIDSVRELNYRRGMMITLTGVDGAGKSTIIEELQQILREKFRKKVVVVRHRPSIFPILSAWKHGKEKAEQISVSHLPRTGTNKSSVSSILRFAYYYTDYLLGQFYIYFKYNLRGYIVLYDRYYFDFIVDGRRSNIHVNQKVTKVLYRLLFKPEVNILLFAPVADILSRKQELDETAINDLTNGYKKLFNKLSIHSASAVYVPVENTDKLNTLRVIEEAIVRAA